MNWKLTNYIFDDKKNLKHILILFKNTIHNSQFANSIIARKSYKHSLFYLKQYLVYWIYENSIFVVHFKMKSTISSSVHWLVAYVWNYFENFYYTFGKYPAFSIGKLELTKSPYAIRFKCNFTIIEAQIALRTKYSNYTNRPARCELNLNSLYTSSIRTF